jgi:hypothetical protein
MATLRGLRGEAFVTAPAGELPVTAPEDHWVVLTDGGLPVSAIPPGRTLGSGAQLPGILVAAADMPRGAAFQSAAFAEFSQGSEPTPLDRAFNYTGPLHRGSGRRRPA